MIIIIPLGGTGERFKSDGQTTPKALIEVDHKPILFYLLDNVYSYLGTTSQIEFVYIPYNREYLAYNLEDRVQSRYPKVNFKFYQLEQNTRGAADTIHIALSHLQNANDCPILCLDSDNFYTTDIIQLWNGANTVFTFNDTLNQPIYSYVTLNNNHYVEDIVEKEKISDLACCGAYGFQSWQQLLYYTHYIIANDIRQKNEYYTSTVIREMMHKEIPFKNVTILNKHFFSLGTPDQVKEYEYALLFDLDGTLVNTDHIYTEVWDTIFKKYKFNYTINTDFFNNFIKGKNDSLFLNYLLPNIDQLTMSHISQLKDELFIKLLQTNTDNLLPSILLPGVLDFFQINKNRKIAIVTSCNRKSAEYIIEYTGLTNYISLLIASDDCTRHKPDPEPYLKAIEQLNLNKAKTIIFEDSYSGYTSAKNAQVGKIVLICNDNSCLDIKTANEYKIPDYRAFNINMLPLLACENPINSISVRIKTELLKILPVKEVISSTAQLKTGYICDIQAYTMVFNANHSENIVLKINNTENELSKTAEKMNLYNNEIHFYKHLCDSLGQYIHIPKCYGIVPYDDTYTRTGIILENLFKYEGTFNLDLNKDIQCLLGVVSEIAKLHHIYYFKNEEDVPLNMRQVTTMNNLVFFKELLNERFDTFVEKNKLVLKTSELEIMHKCFKNYQQNVLQVSTYPLSFCHGDLKSANIFYREPNKTPYFLDWQYTNLNKGVSDIVFLLVESIKFDKVKVDLVVNYYYSLMKENIKCDTYTYDEYTYDEYMNDFKACLGIFPFVVCVWFNSENNDKLLDKIFPVKFMKNLVEYYNYFM